MLTNWKELSRELVFQKYSRKILKVDFQLPDGSVSDFYIKEEGPAVAIVAFTPENQVLLVRQFRPGPCKILLELPGGYIDEGEDAIGAGQRELLEETGYTGEFQKVVDCYDDAYSTMHRAIVVATNCKKMQEQSLDQHEFVEMSFMALDQFREILRSGEMTDVEVGYLALDYLKLL